jgi:hypothetical protein
MSLFKLFTGLVLVAGAASLTACSALTEPDAITISAEPIAKAPEPVAQANAPAVGAGRPALVAAEGAGAPKTGG